MDRAYYNIYHDGAGNKRTIEDVSPRMSAQAIIDWLTAKDTFLDAGGVHRTWQPDERVEVNRYTSAWKAFGQAVQRPRVILVISAHWYMVWSDA
jgi:hypothetical protein